MYLSTLSAIFEDFGFEDVSITEETHLQDHLGMDSQEIAQLIYQLERRFRITVTNRAALMGELRTVGQILAWINRSQTPVEELL